jgi:hypothetical protein
VEIQWLYGPGLRFSWSRRYPAFLLTRISVSSSRAYDTFVDAMLVIDPNGDGHPDPGVRQAVPALGVSY